MIKKTSGNLQKNGPAKSEKIIAENLKTEMPKNSETKKIDFIIDATNVCSWHVANVVNLDNSNNFLGTFSLQPLYKLMINLLNNGKTVQCIFDANTIYHLHDEEKVMYNTLLTDYRDFFYQVIGGIKADDFVLNLASRFSSAVISNDNFNEYHIAYPWLQRDARPQRLFKGGTPIIGGDKLLLIPDLSINLVLDESPEDLFKMLTGLLLSKSKRLIGMVKSFDAKLSKGVLVYGKSEFNFSVKDIQITSGLEMEFSLDKQNTQIVATEIKILQKEVTENLAETEKLKQELELLKAQNLGDRYSGVIDWYDHTKKYGAIKQKDTDETVFFFASGFDHKDLEPEKEMEVIYEKRINKKGPYAVDIRIENISKFLQTGSSEAYKEETQLAKRELEKTKNELTRVTQVMAALHLTFEGIIEITDGKIGVIRESKRHLSFEFNDQVLPIINKQNIRPGTGVKFNIQYIENKGYYATNLHPLPGSAQHHAETTLTATLEMSTEKTSSKKRNAHRKNQKKALSEAAQENVLVKNDKPVLSLPLESTTIPTKQTKATPSANRTEPSLNPQNEAPAQKENITPSEQSPAVKKSTTTGGKAFFKPKSNNTTLKKLKEHKGLKAAVKKTTSTNQHPKKK